jgi:hypothetical protein
MNSVKHPLVIACSDSCFMNRGCVQTVDQIDRVDHTTLVQAMAGAVKDCGGDCCGNH